MAVAVEIITILVVAAKAVRLASFCGYFLSILILMIVKVMMLVIVVMEISSVNVLFQFRSLVLSSTIKPSLWKASH